MAFNSFQYLLFFPIVLLLYYLFPKKGRYVWLLIASCFFYMCFCPKLLIYLAVTVLLTYAVEALLENAVKASRKTRAKWILSLYIISQIGLLGFYKYSQFGLSILRSIFPAFAPSADELFSRMLVPVGISFLTFQSIGYAVDIYRGKVSAERNVLKVGLFLSFFPKLTSGPIERADNLLAQINDPQDYRLQSIKEGLALILFGLFQKLVIADNIAGIINPVLTEYEKYSGIQLLLAVILFAFQIYCDFSGYTNLALGSAKAFGFQLMENFRSPYLSESVADFWRRWHISLTSWFRDYLYIPLGGNRKGVVRKCVNTLIVFTLSGLWHGASWTFVVWGTLNGIYLVIGSLIKTHPTSTHEVSFGTHLRRRLVTFLLVDFAWLFFYMPDLSSTVKLLAHAVTHPGIREAFNFSFLTIFPDTAAFAVLALALLILFWADRMQEQKGSLNAFLFEQSSLFRWCFCIGLLLITIIFGAYGDTYEQTQFIYFQF